LRDLHIVHWLHLIAQKGAIPVRTAPKPPPNFGISVHFCDFQNSQHRELLAIQSSANPGKTISKTLANLCHRNILTASRRNTKDHPHFPWVGLNEILKFRRNGDTSCLCDRAATSAV
jgi:hypothetical protein